MYIDDFIWLSDVVEKLLVKHHVTQEEVEDIFFNKPRFRFLESGSDRVRIYTQRVDRLMQADF